MPRDDDAALKAACAYNAAADHFDDAPLAFWDRYGRLTIERLGIAEGAAVLDVGCGTGASALPAAQQVGPTGSVIGIDVAERLLEIARRKARERKLGNVSFDLMDMQRTHYPDASFDVVVSVFSVFFVPDMVAQVRELWRMVGPGGVLAITSWGPRMFEPASSGWRGSVRQLRPQLYTEFNPWDRITTPATFRELLIAGGVPDAEVVAQNGVQPLRSADDWWRVVLGSGYRWVVEQMDPQTVEAAERMNLDWIRERGIDAIETNVLFATARKPVRLA
jgi:ubiquinone/menaquinone biosynthesis C-methylase UbiE